LANENNEDTGDPPEDLGDILEDRQDRTSEAGTSGSSDEEEEDDHDNAPCVAETKARMGQPSTSGRDHPSTVSPRSPSRTNNEHVVESLELKQKAMENQWPQKTSDGYRKVSSLVIMSDLCKYWQFEILGGMLQPLLLCRLLSALGLDACLYRHKQSEMKFTLTSLLQLE
jgi:hypothetical protein